MNEYQARRQARIERYEQYAKNAANRSEQSFKQGMDLPWEPGQPILVGHHSESRMRRAIERSDNQMRRGVEESKKAAYWQQRVESIENDTSIRRDDPDATDKLREKVAALSAELERMKAINAYGRKHKTLTGISPELTKRERYALLYGDDGQVGYPAWETANKRANLRRYEQRLKELSR